MTRLMVCGARDWPEHLKQEVPGEIRARMEAIPNLELVMHGGARGVDAWTHQVAGELGLEVRVYLPALSVPSPRRYHERNDRMLDEADMVLAFPYGESRGTRSVIRKARDRNIHLWVVQYGRRGR